MPQEKTLTHVYEAEWDVVVKAYQQRFVEIPNEKLPAVVKVEFEDCDVDENGILQWKVIGTIDPPVAYWLKTLTGCYNVQFETTNTLDREKKQFTVHVTNLDYTSILTVTETNTFAVHEDNPEWTLYTQHSKLEVIPELMGWRESAEQLILDSYLKEYDKGREVDQSFIDEMMEDGVPKYGHLEKTAMKKLDIEMEDEAESKPADEDKPDAEDADEAKKEEAKLVEEFKEEGEFVGMEDS